ncbi:ABC transporter permease [Schlesneria sp. DSM 10557]|uniref:ABC transporter permease n=1 Tax=Schlesneria sp. DSM 10557 TaxID=3044399 RepID=UPI0035A14E9F
MFEGTTTLFERSLRVDGRAFGPHLARLFLVSAIYLAIIFSYTTAVVLGAPGLRFFLNIVYIDLIFMTLLGLSFFSTSITEEKEEDTLGLLLMAGISSSGLLFGKSGGRLVQALLLIVVQYPFTLLAVTFGGVTQHQIQATYAAMLAYLILLSGAGLVCSTISKNNRVASIRLLIIVVGYLTVALACRRSLVVFPWLSNELRTIVRGVSESCIFLQIGPTMTSGFGESIWSTQVISNVLGGLACYPLAWGLFGMTSRQPATEAISRGLVSANARRIRILNAGRVWSSPLVWKDFYFSGGGFAAIMIRFFIYVLLYLTSIEIITSLFGPMGGQGERVRTGSFLFMTCLMMSIDLGLLLSRSIQAEVRGKTWTSLVLVSNSVVTILLSKLMGIGLSWLPGPISLVTGIYFTPSGLDVLREALQQDPEPWMWVLTSMIVIPHASALFATYVRWGALPLGICCAIASFFTTIGVIMASTYNSRGVSTERSAMVVVSLFVLGGCALSSLAVWWRMKTIASQS